MKFLQSIFQFAFGCHHNQLSRVFTIKRRTYRVCFECGQEIEYSWTLMHSLSPNVGANVYRPPISATQVKAPVISFGAAQAHGTNPRTRAILLRRKSPYPLEFIHRGVKKELRPLSRISHS